MLQSSTLMQNLIKYRNSDTAKDHWPTKKENIHVLASKFFQNAKQLTAFIFATTQMYLRVLAKSSVSHSHNVKPVKYCYCKVVIALCY